MKSTDKTEDKPLSAHFRLDNQTLPQEASGTMTNTKIKKLHSDSPNCRILLTARVYIADRTPGCAGARIVGFGN
jgi:hypothetical protein